MILSIPYSEAIQIAKEKSGKEITLSAVNEKTIKVGYVLQAKIPLVNKIISKELGLEITYEKLVCEDLHLSYNGEMGANMVIDGVKHLLPQLVSSELYELCDDRKIIIHLGQIDKVHDALQKIRINDVSFEADNMEILFQLKI